VSEIKIIDQIGNIAGIFTSPVRISILNYLLEGPKIVTDIVKFLGLNQAVTSKQLGILKNSGLLVCNPSGRCREYRLADSDAVEKVIDALKILSQKNDLRIKNQSNEKGEQNVAD